MSSHPEKQPEAPTNPKESTHDLLTSLQSISLKHISRVIVYRITYGQEALPEELVRDIGIVENGFAELCVLLASQEGREDGPPRRQARRADRVTTWGELVSDMRRLDAKLEGLAQENRDLKKKIIQMELEAFRFDEESPCEWPSEERSGETHSPSLS